MGIRSFMVAENGNNMRGAFEQVSRAGGEAAGKAEYTHIGLPEGRNPLSYARALLNQHDPRIADENGPAGCIRLGQGRYLFFGWQEL